MYRSRIVVVACVGAALLVACESDDASKVTPEATSVESESELAAEPSADPSDSSEEQTDTVAGLTRPAWAAAAQVADDAETPACDSLDKIDDATGQPPNLEPSDPYTVFVASVKEHAASPSKQERFWRLNPPTDVTNATGEVDKKQKLQAEAERVRKQCAEWVNQPVPTASKGSTLAGDCRVQFQHGEKVAVIAHVTECGGDSCSIDRYIWRADWTKPRAFGPAGSDAVEVAPELDEVFYHRAMNAIDMHTFRSTIDGEATCRVAADCFSPTLSPDGSFLLCRNLDGDLLNVSTAGGKPQIVDSPDIAKDRTTRVRMQWAVYPTPARFLENGRVEYDLVTEKEGQDAMDIREQTFEVALK